MFKSKMDKFVKALRVAMVLAKDIPGIKEIHWELSYTGQTQAVRELVGKVNDMMNEVNGNGTGTVDGEEVTLGTKG